MALQFVDKLSVQQSFNALISGSGGAVSTAFDLGSMQGSAFLDVNVRSGGTNAMTIAITHSQTVGGAYTAVPATALYSPAGVNSPAIPTVTAGGLDLQLIIDKEQVSRFIQVAFTGTTLTQNVAVAFIAQKSVG